MIETIQLLRNIGVFDSVNAGTQLPLNRLALMYAENGRGKTTLAAVLRSLGTGDPLPIEERRRLGAAHTPHVVVASTDGAQAVFQNGAWANRFGDIAVFDDHFVSENVCSGMVVEAAHRQSLHELIIGAQGVALNAAVQQHVGRIEQHIRDLQTRANAIPVAARGRLGVDAFCALDNRDDLDNAILNVERNLAAARDAEAIRQQAHFLPFTLPDIDLAIVAGLVARDLPALEAEAAAQVQAHLSRIGDRAEAWVGDGMGLIAGASEGQDHQVCPFCAQDLAGSPLIVHYQAYFSAAYTELRQTIANAIHDLQSAHSGEIQAAFERAINVAAQTRQFWARYADVPEVTIDTGAIALVWKDAFEAVLAVLVAKQNAPLEPLQVDENARAKVAAFQAQRTGVAKLNDALQATRPGMEIVKEGAAAANVTTLEDDLASLNAVRARHSPEINALCVDYLREKESKVATEAQRDAARAALDQYREQVFPAYQTAINDYLGRFNAGFRLHSVNSVNTRAGSSCNYTVLINQVEVPLTTLNPGEPSFRNTLSAGDRNALALAFFFASLDRDPQRNRKIVVIDDPMTSLDENRSLTTVQETRRLATDVQQLIVLSHSKSFLCDLWQGADTALRSALKIARANPGSTLTAWDVRQDCITEHDRRHELVRNYIQNSVGADERVVAAALRPILESFVRVSYPEWFTPDSLLGPFIGLCQQREGTPAEILSAADRQELRDLLDYANLFHHDTNAAWQTANINDHELLNFTRRTLRFARR